MDFSSIDVTKNEAIAYAMRNTEALTLQILLCRSGQPDSHGADCRY